MNLLKAFIITVLALLPFTVNAEWKPDRYEMYQTVICDTEEQARSLQKAVSSSLQEYLFLLGIYEQTPNEVNEPVCMLSIILAKPIEDMGSPVHVPWAEEGFQTAYVVRISVDEGNGLYGEYFAISPFGFGKDA